MLSFLIPSRNVIRCLAVSLLVASASAYFVVTEPTEDTQWQNGKANVITWDKGVLDGVSAFDLEMTRLSSDGLTYIASTIPSLKHSTKSLSVYLEDVPAGDDYFLLFLNSSHGVLYAISPRFTILNASDTATAASTATADADAATVTISGSPNPTQAFATTFPAVESGGVRLMLDVPVLGMMATVFGCALGAAWTLW
ncbi:hypothetical protein CPB85DRAFT_1377308 [Mucidula mucida]|nr:hypothetical protein CPB85DRAFT_1377308 [Mucidula mucida]